MDRNRVYEVVIDGSAVGELWPSQSEWFNVPPGEHLVRVKIDFMGSNELHVAPIEGEVLELTCRGRSSPMAIVSTVFKRNTYLDLHAMTSEESGEFEKMGKGKEPPVPRNLGSGPT
jgi:hypothetical protein